MTEFVQIRLADILSELGEDKTKIILSSFVCPKNNDVQTFLKQKAIEFSKRELAKTTLVFWVSDDKQEKELVGYYTVAPKSICVAKDSISKTMAKRLNYYGHYDSDRKEYIVPAPLIAQLGKNYNNGNDYLISGDDLLQMAVGKVRDIQKEIGGRFTYLECEEKIKLIEFYERNNFKVFGKRKLDKDETNLEGEYLIQLFAML